MACRSMIAACDWVIGPGDGVPGGAIFAEPCVPEQFADDSGVAHCPPSAWLQVARGGPVLVVRPPHTCVVDGGTRCEVVDQLVGELEVVATLDDTIARER
jgi:hypothetical protein